MIYLKVKELLKKEGKSKYWLVKKLDSNYTTVNKILESDLTSIHFVTIEKLCKIFECTPNDIFTIDD